ncbi:MAG: SHOCT domain-containing protein [Candidatus Bipolaricaulis sp.]|nr:SHOCT domain-containing protein [Candidatus Bipolaricaulis sp.]
MLVIGVLFWGSVVALVVYAIHRLTSRGGTDSTTPPRRTPMDYLKERYAKGEITREQFDQMRRDLLDGANE